MTATSQTLNFDDQLWFVLFGLECALNVEFDVNSTESLFQDEKADTLQEKPYVLYSRRGLRVTASMEAYFVVLTVESDKTFEPSLAEITERAKFLAFRKARWQTPLERPRYQVIRRSHRQMPDEPAAC